MSITRKWLLFSLSFLLVTTGAFSTSGSVNQAVFAEETVAPIPIDAYDQISPDWAAEYNGLIIDDSAIGYVAPGSWIRFNDVDFGDNIPKQFEMEVATASAQERPIKVRIDSLDGPLLGSGIISPTGGWENFELQGFNINEELDVLGVHDVFIIFNEGLTGYGGNFNWFRFSQAAVEDTIPNPIDAYDQISPDWAADYNGLQINDSIIGFTQAGAWVRFNNVDFTDTIPKTITMEYSSGGGAPTRGVEIRVDSVDGPVLGSGTISITGAWSNYALQEFALDEELEVTGVHDVFIIFDTGGNFKWFRFGNSVVPPITSLYVTAERTVLGNIGQTTALQVTGMADNGMYPDLPEGTLLTYASSDTQVVTIDEQGIVTAQGLGTAEIIVETSLNGMNITESIEITVVELVDVDYYVSPSGSDMNPGTIEQPFQTIRHAQEVVRIDLASGLVANVSVVLRGGIYEFKEKLAFTPQDSARDGYIVQYIAYPGEEPILEGGSPMTNWEPVDGHIYKTQVDPDVDFQTMYENNERSIMARQPNIGEPREGYMHVEKLIPEYPNSKFGFKEGDIPLGLEPGNGLQIDIWPGGVNGTINWSSYTRDIIDIDYEERIITLENSLYYEIGPGSRYYIRGDLAFLDAPGEFFLDKAEDTLYYWPRSLPIEDQSIIGPNMLEMIGFTGTSETNLVENIKLEGLTIRHSDYRNTSPIGEYAMIHVENAKSIRIQNNHIYNIGRIGIDYHGFVRDSVIANNWIHDIAFNGVHFENGDIKNNIITNNHIHDIGVIIGHGTGIRLSRDSEGTIVTHNRIHDSRRYAISLKNGTSNNLIQNNDLSVANTDTQDTGVIEVNQPGLGNVIDSNRIYDSNIYFSFGFGIYLDDSASGVTVSNNVIHDLQHEGNGFLRNPILVKGVENQILNNFVINNNSDSGPLGLSAENEDLIVKRNIFYNSGDTIYKFPDWSKERFAASDYQLLYNDNGIYGVSGAPNAANFEEWQTFRDYKFDQRSMTANPQFMNVASGDYRLPYYSPAKKLGIEDIDFANIGLLESFEFGQLNDPIAHIYPVSTSGETLTSISMFDSQTMDIDVMGRTETGYYTDLSSATIDFVSSSPQVASVDSSGVITAVSAGVATITVTVERGSELLETTLYVLVDDKLNTVHVNAMRSTMPIGQKTVLHIVGESDQGAFTMFNMVSDGVVVTNQNPQVVAIDEQGNITALANGTATIDVAVTMEGVTKTALTIIEVYDPIDAYETIYPLSSSESNGLTVEDELISDTNPGSWVLYKNVDFGTIIPNRLVVKAAVPSTHADGVMEVRLDHLTGPLVGSISVEATADWSDFQEQVAVLDGGIKVTGVHDIYFVFSESNNDLAGNFRSVQFDREPVPPSEPWKVVTYGNVTKTIDVIDGNYKIDSNGANIWGAADEFTFMYQDIPAIQADHMSITATVQSVHQAHKESSAGVMIRNEDEADSFNVIARVRPNGGLRFTYRNDENLETWYQAGPDILFPATIKLTREGDVFTGYYLKNDEYWEQFGQISTKMSGDVMAGIGVFSQIEDQTHTTVSNISIETEEPPITGLQVSADPTILDTLGQTTTLQVSGLWSDGTAVGLPEGTVLTYTSSDPSTVTVDVYGGMATAQGLGMAEITVSTTLNGTDLAASIEIEVIPTLDNTNVLLDQYYSDEKVETPLYHQLSNRLSQAEHHLDDGRITQAIKHLNDFLKHINNPAMQSNIDPEAKAQLVYGVQYLIESLE